MSIEKHFRRIITKLTRALARILALEEATDYAVMQAVKRVDTIASRMIFFVMESETHAILVIPGWYAKELCLESICIGLARQSAIPCINAHSIDNFYVLGRLVQSRNRYFIDDLDVAWIFRTMDDPDATKRLRELFDRGCTLRELMEEAVLPLYEGYLGGTLE